MIIGQKRSEDLNNVRKNMTQNYVQNILTYLCTDTFMDFFFSQLEYRRDRVTEEQNFRAIQEALAGFINDEVIDRKG